MSAPLDNARLTSLAEACEKASGADRELDQSIHIGIGYTLATVGPRERYSHLRRWMSPTSERVGRRESANEYPPRYTASLDAARSLVPEGLVFNLGNDNGCWAHVWKDDLRYDGNPVDGRGSTPALALTAACLRALAAQVPA